MRPPGSDQSTKPKSRPRQMLVSPNTSTMPIRCVHFWRKNNRRRRLLKWRCSDVPTKLARREWSRPVAILIHSVNKTVIPLWIWNANARFCWKKSAIWNKELPIGLECWLTNTKRPRVWRKSVKITAALSTWILKGCRRRSANLAEDAPSVGRDLTSPGCRARWHPSPPPISGVAP